MVDHISHMLSQFVPGEGSVCVCDYGGRGLLKASTWYLLDFAPCFPTHCFIYPLLQLILATNMTMRWVLWVTVNPQTWRWSWGAMTHLEITPYRYVEILNSLLQVHSAPRMDVPYTYYSLFNLSPTCGHLGCFQHFAMLQIVTLGICISIICRYIFRVDSKKWEC